MRHESVSLVFTWEFCVMGRYQNCEQELSESSSWWNPNWPFQSLILSHFLLGFPSSILIKLESNSDGRCQSNILSLNQEERWLNSTRSKLAYSEETLEQKIKLAYFTWIHFFYPCSVQHFFFFLRITRSKGSHFYQPLIF